MPFGWELLIKLVVIGALIPVTALVLGYAELKISAHAGCGSNRLPCLEAWCSKRLLMSSRPQPRA